MANIKIQDVYQRVQYTATNLQTQFSIVFPFLTSTDVIVYQNSTLLVAGTNPGEYGITGAGSPSGGLITLVTGATTGDIITIIGAMPIDRTSIYSATISNLTGSDLNDDFNREIIMTKQIETSQKLLQLQYYPYAQVSQNDAVTKDRWLPILGANQGWAMNPAETAIIVYDLPEGGAAPKLGTYLIQTANANLPNAQVMGTLASGFVVNTTTTGVQLSRVFTGTANQVDIANGTGIAGNPTASLSANLSAPGTFTVQGTTAVNAIINDDTLATATAQNLATALSLKTYIDNSAGGLVDSVTGTANQVDIDNTDPQNPVASLSATLSTPGTFTVQGTVAISAIINDNTMATALATNVPTALSIKTYVDNLVGVGPVVSITGTANQVLANGVAGVAQVGAVTLTTPQAIATTSSPTFNNITLTSGTVANAPTVNTDIVNKAYADSIAAGFNFVNPVVAASIANFASTYANGAAGVGATLTATANAAFSLDGVAGILNARYLIKNQTTTFENGIYTLTQVGNGGAPAILTRATDFDTPTEIQPGDLVPVLSGTQNISTLWLQTQTVSLVGVDAIVFTQFAALSSFQNTSLTYMLMGA